MQVTRIWSLVGGAEIPHASGPKNKKHKKQKQYCNKFNKDLKKKKKTSARHVLKAYDRLNSLRQPGNFELSIDIWAQGGIKKKKTTSLESKNISFYPFLSAFWTKPFCRAVSNNNIVTYKFQLLFHSF